MGNITCWMAIVLKGSGTTRRKMNLIISSIVLAIAATSGLAAPSGTTEKDGRVLSLFSVVTFKNTDCVAVSGSTATGNTGKCFSSSECTSNGGQQFGNCASGFGVCCIFSLAACGGTVNKNSTYISNAGYNYKQTTQTGITTAGTCTYTINYASTNICQLRLDFQNLDLQIPAGTGDDLTITGPTGANTSPVITGLNTGRHMYVATGASTTATTLAVVTRTAGATRIWNIRVDQIECDSAYKAPEGCTQYFTGSTGTLTTYNFRTTPNSAQELGAQDYSFCIKQASGSCTVQYKQTTTAPSSFILGSAITAAKVTGCGMGVTIPRALNALASDGVICQGTFSLVEGATTGATITQNAPFIINYTNLTPAIGQGFSLDYAQQGC